MISITHTLPYTVQKRQGWCLSPFGVKYTHVQLASAASRFFVLSLFSTPISLPWKTLRIMVSTVQLIWSYLTCTSIANNKRKSAFCITCIIFMMAHRRSHSDSPSCPIRKRLKQLPESLYGATREEKLAFIRKDNIANQLMSVDQLLKGDCNTPLIRAFIELIIISCTRIH